MNTIWVLAAQVGSTIQVKGFDSEAAAKIHLTKRLKNVDRWTIQEMRVYGTSKEFRADGKGPAS